MRLAGTGELALTVATVVESKDIEPYLVQGCNGIYRVAEVAVLAMKIENRELAVCSTFSGWNPPALEARLAGFRSCETNRVEEQVYACWSSGDRGGRVVEQLPTSLPEQQAERAPRTEGCRNKRNGYRG